MMFLISAEQGQAIYNYLATKPYNEVVQLVEILKSLQPAPDSSAGAGRAESASATPAAS
ncbi:MAG: hypothetical protein KGM42_10735 [Hyphomicrobiales bacterium]|nr:hypothetical protein [Hyphomicrobiales bacterium]